ncbi:MAG: hypothetical protein R2836_04675 [Chitinophagales bacterium]
MIQEKDILVRQLKAAMRLLARLLKLKDNEIDFETYSDEDLELVNLSTVKNLLDNNVLNSTQYDLAKTLLQLNFIRNKSLFANAIISKNDYKAFKNEWELLLTELENKSGVFDFELQELKDEDNV